jgi:hypothetical protein
MDDVTATRMIVKHYLDQDEMLLKLLGRVLQTLHASDQSPSRRGLELDVMSQMIDCYESLGRFDEAAEMKMARVIVAHEHKIAACGIEIVNEYDDSLGIPAPCQPIGCDNGYHLPGCTYAQADATDDLLTSSTLAAFARELEI